MSGPGDGVFPTFVVVGAQHAAAEWLAARLDEHPDIFVASGEPAFFTDAWGRGPVWYLTHFREVGSARAVGECTPSYLRWSERPGPQAARIDGFLPDVRVVAVLRNPVDRAVAAHRDQVARGAIDPNTSVVDHVGSVRPEDDPLGIVTAGWYGACLRPFVERFGDRLLVLRYDDLAARPVETLAMAARHVGVDPDLFPGDVQTVSEQTDPALAPAVWGELFSWFVTDLERLERLVDVDTAPWRRHGAGPAA